MSVAQDVLCRSWPRAEDFAMGVRALAGTLTATVVVGDFGDTALPSLLARMIGEGAGGGT